MTGKLAGKHPCHRRPMYKKGKSATLAKAPQNAKDRVTDAKLLEDTMANIMALYYKAIMSRSANESFSSNNFIRGVTKNTYAQWKLWKAGGTARLYGRATYLAIRFASPANACPMNETLGGYLLDMDRADLLQGKELSREEPEATPLLANPGGRKPSDGCRVDNARCARRSELGSGKVGP